MKNRSVCILLVITALFVGISIGFSIGRNANTSPVELSVLSNMSQTAPAVPASKSASSVADPTVAETAAPETTTPPVYPVDVNSADLDALMTLPGIGPVLAQRILDYRTVNGPFRSLEELANVKGIGAKRLEAIWDYAIVGG